MKLRIEIFPNAGLYIIVRYISEDILSLFENTLFLLVCQELEENKLLGSASLKYNERHCLKI